MNFELLLKAVEIAEALRIPSTFVETNCFWCKNDDFTRERLMLIKEKGLKGIMISVNPFYAEYVPFERTERCIQISQEVFGENMMVYQLDYYNLFKKLGIAGTIPVEDYLSLTQEKSLSGRVELFLMGRAADRLKDLYPSYPSGRFLDMACRPEFLRSRHNHFDNYGNFMPGYCGGISLGSWFELDRLVEDGIDLKSHPVLRYLVSGNMKGLLNFAFDLGFKERDKGYVSKCHLCLDIRKYLAMAGDFKELKPMQFYKQLKEENGVAA